MAVFIDDRCSGAGSLNGHTAATGGAWATDTSQWSSGSATNPGSPDEFQFDGGVSAYKSPATPGSANYRVDTQVKMLTGTGDDFAAIFARWSTGASGYRLTLQVGSGTPLIKLARFDSGSESGSVIATTSSYTPDTSYHELSIEVLAGGVVRAYLDDTQVLTLTDPSPITSAGFVSVGGRNSALSDVVAADDTGGGGSSAGAAAHYYRQLA